MDVKLIGYCYAPQWKNCSNKVAFGNKGAWPADVAKTLRNNPDLLTVNGVMEHVGISENSNPKLSEFLRECLSALGEQKEMVATKDRKIKKLQTSIENWTAKYNRLLETRRRLCK